MNFNSAPNRHRWLSNNSMMVAIKLATSFKPDWKSAKLGDIAEKIQTGTTPPSQERRYYDGDINWFTPADIGGNRWLSTAKKSITDEAVSEKKARIFDVGTILITCIGHIGRVGILSKTSSANQQITGVRFNEIIDPEFAYYGLFARQDELQAAAPTASTLSILNQNRLSNIDFCFPSLKEQIQISKFLSWYEDRLINGQPFTNDYPTLPDYLSNLPHIVERVEALASRIAKAQSLRNEINEETDLLFSRILSKAYDEALSIAGNTERLDELCTVITDGTHVTPSYMDEGIPFLSVKDVSSGKIDFSRTRFISPEEHAFLTKRCKPEKDDVLFTKVGTTGLAKAIDVDREFSIFVSLALLKIDRNRLLPKYTEYMLNSPKLREQSLQGTRGVGNKNLVLKFIKEYPMPAPPLDEQRRIVAYLDSVQARLVSLRELQSATGEELSALLPSVLDRAFKGEL